MNFSLPLLRPRRKCPYALKTPEQVPLFYGVGGWADVRELPLCHGVGGWADFRELPLCHGVKGYADSGPGLESVED
jgi:hypothetical protein